MANDVTSITKSLDRIADALEGQSGGSSGGGAFLVTCSVVHGTHGETTYTLNKTWKEIHDAQMTGKSVVISVVDESSEIDEGSWMQMESTSFYPTGDGNRSYSVGFGGQYGWPLTTDSETGYPTYMAT